MNEERFALFCAVYQTELEKAVRAHPEFYFWKIEEFPVIFERMKAAIRKNSYSKESPSFKAVCKAFGIKHTYKAINEFLERSA